MESENKIYRELKKRLTTDTYDHGQKLRAEVLREEFACSASTVREILFRLASDGLVHFQDQRGFRVPELSPTKLIELTHMRILLESEGAVLSIRQGGVGWEASLTAAHHKLSHLEKRIHAREDPTDLVDLWFTSEKGVPPNFNFRLRLNHAKAHAQPHLRTISAAIDEGRSQI